MDIESVSNGPGNEDTNVFKSSVGKYSLTAKLILLGAVFYVATMESAKIH